MRFRASAGCSGVYKKPFAAAAAAAAAAGVVAMVAGKGSDGRIRGVGVGAEVMAEKKEGKGRER